MRPEFVALLLFGTVASVIGGIVVNFDRIVVTMLGCSSRQVYPLAVSIAVLIYEHPEQWTCRTHEMVHPKVGAIWTSNEAYGLRVESDFGKWTPGRIERRIIRDAVDWRIQGYIRNRITQAMKLPPA
jgi:hypothetical protein